MRCHQQIETNIAQRAAAGAGGVGSVRSAFGKSTVVVEQEAGEVLAKCGAQRGAGREHGIGIDIATNLARDIGLAWKRQGQCDKRGLKEAIIKGHAERVQYSRIFAHRAVGAERGRIVDQQARGQRLQRLPAVERIGIMCGKESQIIGIQVGEKLDGC